MKESDADLEFVRKIRRKRRFRLSTYIPLFIIAGVVGVVGGGALLFVAAKALPTFGSENWTHEELANYLQSRGIEVHRYPGRAGVYYMEYPANNGYFHEEMNHAWWARGGPIVIVNMASSPSRAREIASESETAFAWGRFIINGAGDYAASIRAALGEPAATTERRRAADKAAAAARGPSIDEVIERAAEHSRKTTEEALEKLRKQGKKIPGE